MHFLPTSPSTCYALTAGDQHVIDRIIIKNLCDSTLEEKNSPEPIIYTQVCDRLIFLIGAALLGLYYIL